MPTAGRYRLVELLGRGAMGEVWRAEDTTLGRQVAIKFLLGQTAVADAAERFRREAQTAAGLNHPNVVAAYDFGEEDGRGYLVMELVSGSSLRQELAARGPLGIEEARRIAGQAATGLAAAHAREVIHRDIKPANLLLAADDTVKVADFGIARAAAAAGSSLTTTGEVLGTSAYLAPERGTGGSGGPESDVYALGCVLYEMLCGQPPFAGDPAAVVYQHISSAPRPPTELRPEMPGALADFVLRMLAKDPAARPTAARTARCLDGDAAVAGLVGARRPAAEAGAPAMAAAEAGTARSTLPLGSRPAPRSRRPGLLATAAMVAVFLAAGVLGFQLNSGPEDGAPAPSPTGSATPVPDRSGTKPPPREAAATTPPPAEEEQAPAQEAPGKAEEVRKQQEEAAKKAIEESRKAAEEERKQQEEAAKKEAEEQKKQ